MYTLAVNNLHLQAAANHAVDGIVASSSNTNDFDAGIAT